MTLNDPVGTYLSEQFQGAQVNRHEVARQDAHEYHVLSDHGRSKHVVLVANEFVADRSPDEVSRLLRTWNLALTLTALGPARLVVTRDGVST